MGNLWAAILAVIFFAIALVLHLASVSKGVLLDVTTFEILGFLCVALCLVPWGNGVLARRNNGQV